MALTLLVLIVVSPIFLDASSQHSSAKGEVSILGMMLQGHIFKNITKAAFGDVCLRECYQDIRCQSFNYVFTEDICELSNRTKEARPEDFVPNFERYYFRKDMKRVPLGSVPELPAETCKEIKTSEGGQAVSARYWIFSIIPEKIVFAYCDMKTEDVDECSSSIFDCDPKANCQNTEGSYRCQCLTGFFGDGKSCSDVDECSSSIPVCDPNANCQNTEGSFHCQCVSGFSGDGKSCTATNEDAPIRLMGGGANYGRVEVYHNGKWGTVCDDHWTINEANVVCRQLGFSSASQASCCAKYGQGSDPVWMDDVYCQGGEAMLSRCAFPGWEKHNCVHSEDASVACNN
ncbi:scavenger receptor cysteine-rich type 1 protein M130-like isoform X2 [Pocillopora damicornis]|uniref:scavenger receptor cysteine-rich type 1 protein M130-like isoform X2 n=1 Tax=Pocillopora damicornis TaxID=46731 RepID=UPI000F551039|nr:scavenger receptor cysteine-rich type 1 protein M130-like isoform X2 [Pocillopora damicornis]